jgi:hypothetical protein
MLLVRQQHSTRLRSRLRSQGYPQQREKLLSGRRFRWVRSGCCAFLAGARAYPEECGASETVLTTGKRARIRRGPVRV